MKKILLTTAGITLSALSALAAETPLWLRDQRISPDGKTIVFCYQGDIFTVPTTGGRATRITSHEAYDHSPVWSPDSRSLAFASNREGSDDVYIVSAEGGVPRRLTFHNGSNEVPQTFAPGGDVVFSTWRMPAQNFDQYPSTMMTQLHQVSVRGGRPRQLSSLSMQQPSYNAAGDMLYTDYKGYENEWRKHHVSSIARDIWIRRANGSHTKLTSFRGEDRNAVWDGQGGFYYLSEQDGTFNVYHRSEAKERAKDKQLTNFRGNPVRFLSRSNDGLLCFGYDGEIYTLRPGQRAQRVSISIISDVAPSDDILRNIAGGGASAYAVSPAGNEYAVVVRGDVFVVNMEHNTSRRVTSTASEERDVSFSADGRTLVYASNRRGKWQIYKSEIVRKADKNFTYAKELKETQLTNEKKPCFQPVFNPKGDQIAFLRDRNEIAVVGVKGGEIRTVVPEGAIHSYSDGDQHFEWSRNGKYILTNYYGQGGWLNVDCALYHADGSGMAVNLTESGYSDRNGRFALGDKAVLFISDRNGYRSHGSWGSTGDVYLMFLDEKTYQNFRMNKEDKALLKADEEAEKAEKAEAEKKKAEAEKKKKEKEDKKKNKKEGESDKESKKAEDKKPADKPKEEDIQLDFDNREARTVRISRNSGSIADAVMSPDGTKLYFVARYENSWDLWEYNLETHASRILSPGTMGSFLLSADGKKIYFQKGDGLMEVGGRTYPYRVEQKYKPVSERQELFYHVHATMRDKFYIKDMHGLDWDSYRTTYERFLPHITTSQDFAEMLSEMLGEVNVSHTGASAQIFPTKNVEATGELAAFYDPKHQGDGLRILEIVAGSPLQAASKPIKAGDIIERVNGELIKADQPIELYFNGLAGKRTILTIKGADGKTFESAVKPTSLSQVAALLATRWIKRREALVKEWSDGRIGYVYIPAMNSPAFRNVFKNLLGKYRNCEAVVVDTRYNGGGWLHEDLAVLLSGKKFSTMSARGQYLGEDPFMQWNKPSCVLMNEGNYSNGHGFPYTYKALGLGKLIGAPVPGTMTAVWWERLFSGDIVYGIPQVAMNDLNGKPLENQELFPDIEVYNTPEDYLEGNDRQLKRAVNELLK